MPTKYNLWCDLDGVLTQTVDASLKHLYEVTGYSVPTHAINAWGIHTCAANYINTALRQGGDTTSPTIDPEELDRHLTPLFTDGACDFYLGLHEHWTMLAAMLRWRRKFDQLFTPRNLHFLTNRPGYFGASTQVRCQTEAWLCSHDLDATAICWAKSPVSGPVGKGPAARRILQQDVPDWKYYVGPDTLQIFIEDAPQEVDSIARAFPWGCVILVPTRPWNASVKTSLPPQAFMLPDETIYEFLETPEDLQEMLLAGRNISSYSQEYVIPWKTNPKM